MIQVGQISIAARIQQLWKIALLRKMKLSKLLVLLSNENLVQKLYVQSNDVITWWCSSAEAIFYMCIGDCFVATTAPRNDSINANPTTMIQEGWWQPQGCHHHLLNDKLQLRTLQRLLAAAFTVIEVLDIPHLTVVGRVHDEVAHIRTGRRQLEAQEQRCRRNFICPDLLRF